MKWRSLANAVCLKGDSVADGYGVIRAAARNHSLLSLQRGLDYGRKEFSAGRTVSV